MATLIVCNGKRQGREFVLPAARITVGREQACDIRLSSSRVSRQHCTLQPDGDGLIVRDLSSRNGTFVNDRPIKGEAALVPGDRLRIGPWEFEVAIGGPSGVAIAPGDDETIESEIADWLTEGDEGPKSFPGSDTTMVPPVPIKPKPKFDSVAAEAADIIRRHHESRDE